MTATRLYSILTLGVALASPALADPRQDVMQNLARCAGQGDDRTWLECYYGAAQPMRARLGLSPAPQIQTQLSTPALPMTPARPAPAAASPQFGADSLASQQKPQASPSSRIATHMAAYSFDTGGHFTVTLSNGQVWQQDANDGLMAGWKKPAAQYVITIRRGLFGDYNLVTADREGAYKVKRIR